MSSSTIGSALLCVTIDALERTSIPTGHLQVPELDLHTIYDHLVPVEQERTYRDIVEEARKATLLRQAYVNHIGHCNFTAAELVAGVETLRQRVQMGRWGSLAQAEELQQFATSPGLGDAAFIDFDSRGLPTRCGFVHVPRCTEQVPADQTASAAGALPRAKLVEAVECCMRVIHSTGAPIGGRLQTHRQNG